MDTSSLLPLLVKALTAREGLFDNRHESAFRLFNGFSEGYPELSIDLYGATLVIHNYAPGPHPNQAAVQQALDFLVNHPVLSSWLRAVIVKDREHPDRAAQQGRLLFGAKPDHRIREHGVWHALDITMNRDASLYLDTRLLRKWLIDNARGRSVLNTFAYTGSLGTAAMAGGARRVVQVDRKREFLNLAKTSYTLNGFPIHKPDFIPADFFEAAARLKRSGERFDLAILDPPFFSSTSKGRVDQLHESSRLINKLRPLVSHDGLLVAINNALFLSGAEYMQSLELLCEDGYLTLRELIPVPQDFTGYPSTAFGSPVTDPSPFNHSTKIAVLGVRRKINDD